MKRTLAILALAAGALAAAPGSAQAPGDTSDLQTLTVIEVDPAANEIRVRETGTTRIRTIELDERSAVTGGTLGGRMDFRDLRPGDTIRVPGAVGSVSDRVRAEEVQVLAAPRQPGEPDVGAGPGTRSRRAPSTLQPDPDSPSAIGTDPETRGRVGADPGATGDATRGTGSQTGSGASPGTGRSVGPTGTAPGTGTGTMGGTGGGTGSTGTTGGGGTGAGTGGAGGP